ncbi:hypothetical protein D3C72_1053860 [compost metagenome]
MPAFSWPELGYRYSRYRLEYSVVFWSSLALPMSKRARRASHASCARPATLSSVSAAAISSARLWRACSTEISEVAMRIVTRRSLPASNLM